MTEYSSYHDTRDNKNNRHGKHRRHDQNRDQNHPRAQGEERQGEHRRRRHRRRRNRDFRPISFWHPASLIATVFGIGKIRWAPGTFGSLVAFPVSYGAFYFFDKLGYAILGGLTFLLFFIGSKASNAYMRKTNRWHDPKEIVIDEVVGQLLTVLLCHMLFIRTTNALPMYGGGLTSYPTLFAIYFIYFRLFDITKPWPIRWFDRNVKGGLGVMADDVVAAIFAAILPVATILLLTAAMYPNR